VWAGQNFTARDLEADLSAIDRIEVVRGPASILFGTGAFFGVINVVPRKRVGENKYVEGVVGAGGQNGAKARVMGSVGHEGSSLMLTGAGLIAEGAPITQLGSTTVMGLDGERSFGVATHGEWNGFTLTGKLNQRRKQIPTAPLGSAVGVPGTEYTDVRGFAELKYEKAWERVTVTARAAYDASRYRGWYAQLDTEGNRFRDTDTGGADWLTGEARIGVTLFPGNRLTASFEAQGQFVYQFPVGTPAEQHTTRILIAGTVIDEWQIFSRLFVQAGLRVDKYFDLDTVAFSPRGAIVGKFYDGGITKVVVGRAFRAPNIYETTFSDNFQTQRAPDSPLKPEYITTFEAEHSHDFTKEFRVTAGGFYNLIDSLVVLAPDTFETPLCGPPSAPFQCYSFTNSTDRVTAGGAELELRWQPGRFTLVDASYSFVILGGADITGGAYPAHVASLRAMVPLKEGLVRLSGQGVFQSARRAENGSQIGEAFLLNFGLSGEYGPVRYFAGVQNLLDQKYIVPVLSEIAFRSVPQYGRTFMIELAASF
jgi:outer membrane receptor protein involved in Fe transport